MWALVGGFAEMNLLWHALPLILVVSLVYGATRHETPREILLNAYRAATWIVSFMAIIFGLLLFVTWLL